MKPFPCGDHPAGVPLFYLTFFRGVSRDIVHLLKYSGRKELGKIMGKRMGAAMAPATGSVIVPVPLHRGSPRTFNQSLELAKGISSVWGSECRDLLEWTTSRPSQVLLASGERRNMPPDAMSWKGGASRRVWIVDDVCTTGATIRSAIEAVVSSGSSVEGVFSWSMAIAT
jgi:predicted amidophosphoribosyltransferase